MPLALHARPLIFIKMVALRGNHRFVEAIKPSQNVQLPVQHTYQRAMPRVDHTPAPTPTVGQRGIDKQVSQRRPRDSRFTSHDEQSTIQHGRASPENLRRKPSLLGQRSQLAPFRLRSVESEPRHLLSTRIPALHIQPLLRPPEPNPSLIKLRMLQGFPPRFGHSTQREKHRARKPRQTQQSYIVRQPRKQWPVTTGEPRRATATSRGRSLP